MPLPPDYRKQATRARESADADMISRDSGIHAGPFPPVNDGTYFTLAKASDLASTLVAWSTNGGWRQILRAQTQSSGGRPTCRL